ncbi:MAG: AAA family ATPase [Candidatus Margulisiibacteriota bacterium]|jgi:chromosome partitioning protein
MPVISVINQKGGCGKTTTAINLSAAIAVNQKKVLLIDMDPQGHAALGLGINADNKPTIFDALDFDTDKPLKELTIKLSEHFHLIPSNIFLSALEQKMAGKAGRENRLRDKISSLRKSYDHIIIDCPPSLGLLTINSLICSDRLIIPVDVSIFSLHGIEKLQETIIMLKNKLGHKLELFGLATIFDQRTNFASTFLAKLKETFGPNLFKTIIPRTIKMREAVDSGVSIIDYDFNSKGAQSYLALAVEVMKMDKHKLAKIFNKVAVSKDQPTKEREVVFALPKMDAKTVQIAGEFNNWNPERSSLKQDENGNWKISFPLTSGTAYQYKYVIDGEWVVDPQNEEVAETTIGGINSVITVR